MNDVSRGDLFLSKGDYVRAEECYRQAKERLGSLDKSLEIDVNLITCLINKTVKEDPILEGIGLAKLEELNTECQETALKIERIVNTRLAGKRDLATQNSSNMRAVRKAIASNSYNKALDLLKNESSTYEEVFTLLEKSEKFYRLINEIAEADVVLNTLAETYELQADELVDKAPSNHSFYTLAFNSYRTALSFSKNASPERLRGLVLSLFNLATHVDKHSELFEIYKMFPLDKLNLNATPAEELELLYAFYRLCLDHDPLSSEADANFFSWAESIVRHVVKYPELVDGMYKDQIIECRQVIDLGDFFAGNCYSPRKELAAAISRYADSKEFSADHARAILRGIGRIHRYKKFGLESSGMLAVGKIAFTCCIILGDNLAKSEIEKIETDESFPLPDFPVGNPTDVFKSFFDEYLSFLGKMMNKSDFIKTAAQIIVFVNQELVNDRCPNAEFVELAKPYEPIAISLRQAELKRKWGD